MPLNQKEGLILLFVVFILFTMDNSNNDDKRSELCVEVKQKFGEMESIFDACIGVSEGMDACIECKEGYLNLQQSFIKLKSLMKNSTCADISYEQNSINKDEKTWLKLGCSHAGLWNDLFRTRNAVLLEFVLFMVQCNSMFDEIDLKPLLFRENAKNKNSTSDFIWK